MISVTIVLAVRQSSCEWDSSLLWWYRQLSVWWMGQELDNTCSTDVW